MLFPNLLTIVTSLRSQSVNSSANRQSSCDSMTLFVLIWWCVLCDISKLFSTTWVLSTIFQHSAVVTDTLMNGFFVIINLWLCCLRWHADEQGACNYCNQCDWPSHLTLVNIVSASDTIITFGVCCFSDILMKGTSVTFVTSAVLFQMTWMGSLLPLWLTIAVCCFR